MTPSGADLVHGLVGGREGHDDEADEAVRHRQRSYEVVGRSVQALRPEEEEQNHNLNFPPKLNALCVFSVRR